MTLIQQRCPGCDRSLQLPEGSIGKKARCPACELTFEVLPPPERLPADLIATPAPAMQSGASFPVSQRYNPLLTMPEAPQHHQAELSPSGTVNPYQATGTSAQLVRLGNIELREVGFGEVMEVSWELFKLRWGYVIVSALLTVLSGIGLAVLGMIALTVVTVLMGFFAENGGQAAGIIVGIVMMAGMLIGVFAFFIAIAWLWTAWSSMLIAIAQGDPNPTSKFIPNWNVTQQVILSTTIVMVVASCVFVFLGIGSAVLANAGLGEAVGVVMAVLGFFLYTFGHAIAQFFMWPWLFTLANEKSTAMGSLRSGLVIAMHGKSNSLLLVVSHLILTLVGLLIVGIGLLVTMPFARLLSTVAYLMTTNQDVIGSPRVANE